MLSWVEYVWRTLVGDLAYPRKRNIYPGLSKNGLIYSPPAIERMHLPIEGLEDMFAAM